MLKYLSLLLFAASAVAQPFPARPGPVIISQPSTGGSSSGGVETNAVIALIEQYGGGGITSNAVVELVVDTWYTNGADAVIVEAQVELNNSSALMIFSVKDTNSAVVGFLPGSAAWNEFGNASKYAFANVTSPDIVQSLGGYVPAYAAFRYYASGTTAALYQNAPNGTRLVYFGAGSGGEGGGISSATATNIAAYQAYLATNGFTGGTSPAQVAAIMATNNAAYATNITIFRSNSVPLIFSNNILSAFTALAKYDYMQIPAGDFHHGTNTLICNADNVTIRGQGEITKIIGWPGGPQIIPGTNNFTLDSVVLTYDFLPLQAFLTESGEESYSQGIGVPSPGVAAAYLGSVTYSQRQITNLTVLNSRIRSQADCLATYTNGFWNGYFKNTAFEYAWDGTVGASGKTNWATFDQCRLDYIGAIFTNEFGALGTLPRMVRVGGDQNYTFNNCVGKQTAALVNLFDTGACTVNGGNWLVDQTTGGYSFNPTDIVGSTTVNGVFYSSTGSDQKAASFRNSLTISNGTSSSSAQFVAYDGLDPVGANFTFDPGGLTSGYSGWVFYDFPVFAPAGFVGPHTGNGAGLTNLLWATNYVAAAFSPTSGYIKFVGSNNALYAVSATKTNLISAP